MSDSVLIIEPNSSGHHFFYVQILVSEALRRKVKVTVATSERAPHSEEFESLLGPFRGQVDWDFGIEELSWASLSRVASSHPAQVTIVPDSDRLFISPRWFRWPNGQLRLLLMRSRLHSARSPLFSLMKTAGKWLSVAGVLASHRNIVVVRLRSSTAQKRGNRLSALDPVVFSPDQGEAVRDLLRQYSAKKWVAVLGAITGRKNVPLVADAISALSDDSTGLLIAGRIDRTERAIIDEVLKNYARTGRPVCVIDRQLRNGELDSMVQAVDCVVLAHSNEGPSGLLGKSLAAGTPVVAAGSRSLRRDARRYPAEIRWVPLERNALTRAISASLESDRRVVDLQTVEQFSSMLLGPTLAR